MIFIYFSQVSQINPVIPTAHTSKGKNRTPCPRIILGIHIQLSQTIKNNEIN